MFKLLSISSILKCSRVMTAFLMFLLNISLGSPSIVHALISMYLLGLLVLDYTVPTGVGRTPPVLWFSVSCLGWNTWSSIWYAHWMCQSHLKYNTLPTKLYCHHCKNYIFQLFCISENERTIGPTPQMRKHGVIMMLLRYSPHLIHLPALTILFIKYISNHAFISISVASALAWDTMIPCFWPLQ